jgi:hypothetical protein
MGIGSIGSYWGRDGCLPSSHTKISLIFVTHPSSEEWTTRYSREKMHSSNDKILLCFALAIKLQ